MTTSQNYTGSIKPTNKVVVSGDPDVVSYLLEGTAAQFIPGRLLGKGTADHQVKIGQKTLAPRGFLGFEQAFGPTFPQEITDAYSAGDWVPVLRGPGDRFLSYAEEAIAKDDLLCPGTNGALRKYHPGAVKTLVVPFTKSTSEVDTGIELPAGAVFMGALVEVEDNVASSTIDVGLLSSETGGDADGFIDGLSCATAGKIVPVCADTTTGNVTLGTLVSTKIKSADGTPIYAAVPKTFVGDGVATTISYTTTDHDVSGNILIMYAEPGAYDLPVAQAEETISAAGGLVIRSLI